MESLVRTGQLEQLFAWLGWAAAVAVGLLVLFFIMRKFLYICRPNQVLIFSGRKRRLAEFITSSADLLSLTIHPN